MKVMLLRTWVQCGAQQQRDNGHSGKEERKEGEKNSCVLRTIVDSPVTPVQQPAPNTKFEVRNRHVSLTSIFIVVNPALVARNTKKRTHQE